MTDGIVKASTPRPSCLLRLNLETTSTIEFVDITGRVVELLRAASVREGLVTIFSRHTTAAIRIQEDEPLLLEDLCAFLRSAAPAGAHYRHNDFQTRTVHMNPDESPNGHAHCQQLLLGSSETIPILDGEMQLGTWQRIFLVELDGPRAHREVLVQVLG